MAPARKALGFKVPGPPPPTTSAAPLPANAFSLRNGLTLAPVGGVVTSGLKVLAVQEFSVGQTSGFEPGDIIISLNGQPVTNEAQIVAVLNSIPRGTASVNVQVQNVKTGGFVSTQYQFTSVSGKYQSNLGRIELTQIGQTIQGTLFLYNKTRVSFQGRLVGLNQISGTWNGPRDSGPILLTKQPGRFGNVAFFAGRVTGRSGAFTDLTVFPIN